MKKIAIVAAAAAFALAACGETTDASEDAIADSVEVPADDAMADAPDPVADGDAMSDEDASDDETTAEGAGNDAPAAAAEAQEILHIAE